MRVGILGAAEARIGEVPIDLGTRKQRALLAALALHAGHPVPPDTLVDLIWGDQPPTAVTPTLHGYVAKLRRALEPDRPPRAPSQVLVLTDQGYELRLADDALDSVRFERAVRDARERIGGVSLAAPMQVEHADEVFGSLSEVLGLWRGTPYAELEDAPAAQAERARLDELRAVALEDRAVAGLAMGRHTMVAGELEVLTSTYPLRERLWGLRAVALAGSGRQADALEVLREVRELLAEELGLEPGAELRELQTAVLRQDPALTWAAPASEAQLARPVATTPAPYQWPLVGRDDELAAMVGLLEQSAGTPLFAAVTGEPGIGKSRLCGELAAVARDLGVAVLVGRCSQDEGAPPLYPWASVLRELGNDLPSVAAEAEGGDESGSRFRAWEEIVRSVLDAAEQQQLLIFLDDLHWADVSTLRVLRLLAETATAGRLLVVCTWRHEPPPTGQLAVVADMLARRHALRLHLEGLSADEAAEIVTSVAATAPTSAEADALRSRTEGNPFFLVEYARLLGDSGDLPALLAEEHPPAAVSDVLTRRLGALPDATVSALRHACVIGRQFDVPTLAALMTGDEDAVIDDLDPALSAGLLREFGVDRFRFAHALIRDTVYAGISQSRRGRLHARTAEVLSGVPGRENEVARHWLAAGPSYADRAWRAAQDAAHAARELFAYDEAVELLTGALTVLDDAGATDEDRFALLIDLARSYLLTDNLVDLRRTVHEALGVAGRLDDLHREVQAVSLLLTKALWQSGVFGGVDEVVVGVIRRALDRLPAGDSAERCRLMVALATEIYYASAVGERVALCEQALEMARRVDDPRLLLDTLLAVPLSLWSPASADQRFELTGEAAELARELGDGIALATALALHASAASESGRVVGLLDLAAEAREQAVKERQLFAQLFLDGLEIPWLAMRGDWDRVHALIADMVVMHERVDVPQTGDALVGAFLMDLLWGKEPDALLAVVDQVAEVKVMPVEASVALILARGGRLDEARERLRSVGAELSPDWWFSLLTLGQAAEAAMLTGDPDLAAESYERLAPFAGRPAAGGSGTVIGVVDFFLAMAAHATGERDLATRHADDAVRLCTEWEIPLAASWFARVREEHGF